MTTLVNKSSQELRNLKIREVKWSLIAGIAFTLSKCLTCKAGKQDFKYSHIFNPTIKITRLEVVIHKNEVDIIQMNFYHHQQRLVAVF